MHNYNEKKLVYAFYSLGIRKGDTVLIRVALNKIGLQPDVGSKADFLIRALLKTVGSKGTIVGLAFTKAFIFPNKNKDYIFNKTKEPITGGFASAMVKWPGAVRSLHPTNSFVAIGYSAHTLLDDHDESKTCFYPIHKLMELNGKMLLIGCVHDSPGFSTVHIAQDKLKLSTKTIYKNKLKVFYKNKDGNIRLFKKRDCPGCSNGFYKFYSHYIFHEKLVTGFCGDAFSICINAKDAFEIEYQLLKNNWKFYLCDNPKCEFCRGGLYYNMKDWPLYYLRNIGSMINKIITFYTKKV